MADDLVLFFEDLQLLAEQRHQARVRGLRCCVHAASSGRRRHDSRLSQRLAGRGAHGRRGRGRTPLALFVIYAPVALGLQRGRRQVDRSRLLIAVERGELQRHPERPQLGQRLAEGGAVIILGASERHGGGGLDAGGGQGGARHREQRGARPDLDPDVCSGARASEHASGEVDRGDRVPHQELADRRDLARVGPDIDARNERLRRRAHGERVHQLTDLRLRAAKQRRVKRVRDLQPGGAQVGGRETRQQLAHALGRARDHDLAGVVQVGDVDAGQAL
mgnify:CR=1 FL=1